MPEYLAPGVFIEEIERGPKPIEGVATSTAAFLGATERGPLRPTFISSYNDYLRQFGDVFDPGFDAYTPYAVRAFFDNGGRRCYVARVSGGGAESATATVGGVTVNSSGPGQAYNRVLVQIGPSSTTTIDDNVETAIGFRLQVSYWASLDEDLDPSSPPPDPTLTEVFDDLVLDPASQSYWEKRVNGNSGFVEIGEVTLTEPPSVDDDPSIAALAGGSDGGAPELGDYLGDDVDPRKRTGLAALDLDPYREVAIVHAPAVDDEVAKAVVEHCERNQFRFAVVDSLSDQANAGTIQPRNLIDSQFGAFYYPWLVISDPRSGARRKIPPGGAVCGIYALTDNNRGVFKAPANETVAGAIDLEFDVDTGSQELLNPRGVNAIRRFPGRGIRVWGARTMSSDPLWKYVNVRRLMIFLEASIFNSTQWVVFEPNNEQLWARVQQTVTLFLRDQWRDGALLGAKEEDAFSVVVGRETMTEDDILNGRLIVEVGVAPVRPAEFVIFRVFQKTQEARS
jgi:phage tail sheath protein FI